MSTANFIGRAHQNYQNHFQRFDLYVTRDNNIRFITDFSDSRQWLFNGFALIAARGLGIFEIWR